MTHSSTPALCRVDAQTITRILLSHDGSTTTLLASLLEEPVRVRVVLQAQRPAATALSPAARVRMDASADDTMIVRRSNLVRPTGAAISANKVVLDPCHPLAADVITGCDIPLGYLLAGQRVEQRRELLARGVRRWSWGPPDSAGQSRVSVWRSYIIVISGSPAFYIEEVFHPDLIPPLPELLDGEPDEHQEEWPDVASAG
ncbi:MULTISPECIES: chorismate pyruvate-lyase family protein [unclassified Nonomuraea]|uniref:chorismate pyruvate-lyase family protein n=1 Tax=unclassified Nonomuraea TaxID=2593643 RepID=UPI0033FFF541